MWFVVVMMMLEQVIGIGCIVIEQCVVELMQKIFDDYKFGVCIQGVVIKQVVVFVCIVEDFNVVIVVQQEVIVNFNQLCFYVQQVVVCVQGEVVLFDKVYEQYKLVFEVIC